MNGFKPTSIVVDGPICIGNWCPQNYGRSYAGSVTLTTAITKSINTIPVRLSISIGKGNARIGRNMIVKTAKDMGLRTPLADTPSLPIGAGEVTVLDHTVAMATFPNEGMAVDAARRARGAHRDRRGGLAVRPRRAEAAPGDRRGRSRST